LPEHALHARQNTTIEKQIKTKPENLITTDRKATLSSQKKDSEPQASGIVQAIEFSFVESSGPSHNNNPESQHYKCEKQILATEHTGRRQFT